MGPPSPSPNALASGHQSSAVGPRCDRALARPPSQPRDHSRPHTSWSLCPVACEIGCVVAGSPRDRDRGGDGRTTRALAQSKSVKFLGARTAAAVKFSRSPEVAFSTSSSPASQSGWVGPGGRKGLCLLGRATGWVWKPGTKGPGWTCLPENREDAEGVGPVWFSAIGGTETERQR